MPLAGLGSCHLSCHLQQSPSAVVDQAEVVKHSATLMVSPSYSKPSAQDVLRDRHHM